MLRECRHVARRECVDGRGERWLLWRGGDEHRAELDILLEKPRDKTAAKRFFQRVLKTQLPVKVDEVAIRGRPNLRIRHLAEHQVDDQPPATLEQALPALVQPGLLAERRGLQERDDVQLPFARADDLRRNGSLPASVVKADACGGIDLDAVTSAMRFVERVISDPAFRRRWHALHRQHGAVFVVHPFREIEDRQRFFRRFSSRCRTTYVPLKYLKILPPHL